MLKIDDFLDHLNRKGTLNPVSENTKKAYRNSLEQFERFLDGRQPSQEIAQEWIQQLLDKGRKPAAVAPTAFERYYMPSPYQGEGSFTNLTRENSWCQQFMGLNR